MAATIQTKLWYATAKPIISSNHSRGFVPCTTVMSSVPVKHKPLFTTVKTYAPASITHFGSAFETIGCAIKGIGNFVTVKIESQLPPGEFLLTSGDHECMPVLNSLAGVFSSPMGFSMSIEKGVPIGVGLGSAVATVCAAAVGLNEIFGGPLSTNYMIEEIYEALDLEVYHVNLVPAMIGNFVGLDTVTTSNPFPFGLAPLNFPTNKPIWFVLAIPKFEERMPTVKEVEDMLGRRGDMSYVCCSSRDQEIYNQEMYNLMVTAIKDGDLVGLGYAMSSNLTMELYLQSFIPGFHSVKEAAMKAGALGCCILGTGPVVVALTNNERKGRHIGERMVEGFKVAGGLSAVALVRTLDRFGAKIIKRV